MSAKHFFICGFVCWFASQYDQVFASDQSNGNDQPFAAAAMTTVLARPLGGYGLTPLVFEPTTSMEGSSSNSVPTKVRKSPVYELIMPNYDEETLPSIPVTTDPLTGTKTLKKIDYESLVSSSPAKLPNKSPASGGNSDYYNQVLSLLKMKDSSSTLYNSVAPIPQYKENSFGNAPLFNGPIQQRPFSDASSSYSQGAPLSAPIQTMRSVQVQEVQDSYENSEPQVIDIPPSAMPIVINFRTSASQIQIHQSHEPSEPREVQETQSQDEPHFLRHSVTKPVIQEVHEIIMPYRRIIQEIRPVEEEIKTIVARGQKGPGAGGIGGGGGGIAGGPLGGAVGSIVGGGVGPGIIGGGFGGKKGDGPDFGSQNALAFAVNKIAAGGGGNKYKSS